MTSSAAVRPGQHTCACHGTQGPCFNCGKLCVELRRGARAQAPLHLCLCLRAWRLSPPHQLRSGHSSTGQTSVPAVLGAGKGLVGDVPHQVPSAHLLSSWGCPSHRGPVACPAPRRPPACSVVWTWPSGWDGVASVGGSWKAGPARRAGLSACAPQRGRPHRPHLKGHHGKSRERRPGGWL